MNPHAGPHGIHERRITASLPTTDIEWLHRWLPSGRTQFGLRLTYQPDARAVEHWMQSVFVPAGEQAMRDWLDMLRQVWEPWLALNPLLALFLPAAGRAGHGRGERRASDRA